MKKFYTLLLTAALAAALLGASVTALAADTASAVIDSTKTGSLTIYKYDGTSAKAKAGWNAADHRGTGERSAEAEQTLAPYTLKGVGFTYLKIADFVQEKSPVEVRFSGVPAALSDILGLAPCASYRLEDLQNALKAKSDSNAVETRNALERYAAANGGTAMPETGADGKTSAAALPLGLYLIVETKVPENVVTTTAPFLVSLPFTNIGGTDWVYDAYVYPKNQTGNPTLTKTVREAPESGGKSEEYAKTATASIGDTLNFHISSKLPNITSKATYLTAYTFVDTASAGLMYTKDGVEIGIYSDAECRRAVRDAQGNAVVWKESDAAPMFAVDYDDGANAMTISMTEAGLAEINPAYAGCTMRISYSGRLNGKAVLGDAGNPNTVELTWKRTNENYFDTLRDCCHIYTYGLDIVKEFSSGQGDFSQVEFLIRNATDKTFVTAELSEGVWYAVGFAADEASATHFVPDSGGKLTVRGLEDDEYALVEVKTADGYSLLKDDIAVVIKSEAGADICPVCLAPLLTAKAWVNGEPADMAADGDSVSAFAAFKVINFPTVDLPETGDIGIGCVVCLGVCGVAAALVLLLAAKRGKAKSAD